MPEPGAQIQNLGTNKSVLPAADDHFGGAHVFEAVVDTNDHDVFFGAGRQIDDWRGRLWATLALISPGGLIDWSGRRHRGGDGHFVDLRLDGRRSHGEVVAFLTC